MPKFSRNYKKLYDLVCEGNKIVGFVDYEHCRDVCEIWRKHGDIYVGVRGHSYSSVDAEDKKEFIKACNRLNLDWIKRLYR